MKTILVPTDFSKNAYSALFYATQLLKNVACEFIILHSFEDQVSNLTSRIDIGKTELVVDKLYETTEVKCSEIKHKIILDTKNSKHSYRTLTTSTTLSRAINKIILDEPIDYVVMGGKGNTGTSTILMGSNTLEVMREIKSTPLLIIPKEIDFKPIKTIGFATGFKRPYSREELLPLGFLASLNSSLIKVLHIYKEEKLSETQRVNFHNLFELLKANKPESNWLSGSTDNYDAITSYLSKEHTDVLAMIYYKHNFFTRIFKEATLKNIVQYSRIPFLILPAQD